MSTDVYVPTGSLADAIAWNRGSPTREQILRVAQRVGLIDDRTLPDGLDTLVAEGGSNISGGQRMRIGIARFLLSSKTVLADEPTAKLDPETARLVRLALIETARHRLVVVATHDRRLIEAADLHHSLRPQPQAEKMRAA